MTLAPGAKVNGNVTIGDDVYIGAGAIIRQGLTIGRGAWLHGGCCDSRCSTRCNSCGQSRAPNSKSLEMRIFSRPHMSGTEEAHVADAFASNLLRLWVLSLMLLRTPFAHI